MDETKKSKDDNENRQSLTGAGSYVDPPVLVRVVGNDVEERAGSVPEIPAPRASVKPAPEPTPQGKPAAENSDKKK